MTTDIRGLSTRGFFVRANRSMGDLRAQADRLQTQVSTGERLSRSSDDPVAAAQLRRLQRAAALSEVDKANADLAAADLNLADDALTGMTDIVLRAKDLATQAGNDALNNDQRISIGRELAGLYRSLVGLANSRDSSGNALFGGTVAGDAYSFDGAGNAVYQGAGTPDAIAIGAGQTVTRSITGPEIMQSGPAAAPIDLLDTLKGLADTLQAGGIGGAAAARAALSPLDSGIQGITTAQTVIGSRLAFVDLTTERRETQDELRTEQQTRIGGTDLSETVVRLQETMTVLEASQASFARLSKLSLMDLLR